MPAQLQAATLSCWHITHRATAILIEHLPTDLWPQPLPGAPRRTVRMIAGHVHNCRCTWAKAFAPGTGIDVPGQVDRRHVSPADLLAALEQSYLSIAAIVRNALERGGYLPAVRWLNFPPDAVHFVTYLAAHEAHHRGQLVMLARQLGHRLPDSITNGLWQWSKRAKESLR